MNTPKPLLSRSPLTTTLPNPVMNSHSSSSLIPQQYWNQPVSLHLSGALPLLGFRITTLTWFSSCLTGHFFFADSSLPQHLTVAVSRAHSGPRSAFLLYPYSLLCDLPYGHVSNTTYILRWFPYLYLQPRSNSPLNTSKRSKTKLLISP